MNVSENSIPDQGHIDLKCVINDGTANFTLIKNHPKLTWTSITKTGLSKDEKHALREEALVWKHEYEKEASRETLVRTRMLERKAISDSIDEDQKRRERLQAVKAKVEADFFKQPEKPIPKSSFRSSESKPTFNSSLAAKVADERERLKDLPPPRTCGTVVTTFTRIKSKAPEREAKDGSKDIEWQKNRIQSRQDLGMTIDELIQKGERFFKAEDYQSALEVYTHAIDNVTDNYPSFYNNRGAVHLKIGHYQAAISDCSKALELLTPPCDGNALQRFKALLRRGMALVSLNLFEKGLGEYKAALAIFPDDDRVQQYVTEVEEKIKSNQKEEDGTEEVE